MPRRASVRMRRRCSNEYERDHRPAQKAAADRRRHLRGVAGEPVPPLRVGRRDHRHRPHRCAEPGGPAPDRPYPGGAGCGHGPFPAGEAQRQGRAPLGRLRRAGNGGHHHRAVRHQDAHRPQRTASRELPGEELRHRLLAAADHRLRGPLLRHGGHQALRGLHRSGPDDRDLAVPHPVDHPDLLPR